MDTCNSSPGPSMFTDILNVYFKSSRASCAAPRGQPHFLFFQEHKKPSELKSLSFLPHQINLVALAPIKKPKKCKLNQVGWVFYHLWDFAPLQTSSPFPNRCFFLLWLFHQHLSSPSLSHLKPQNASLLFISLPSVPSFLVTDKVHQKAVFVSIYFSMTALWHSHSETLLNLFE